MSNEYNLFLSQIDSRLKPQENFDVVKRELIVGEKSAVLYFIDGFIKDDVYEKMLEYLFNQTPQDIAEIDDMKRFSKNKMPYVEVDVAYDVDTVVKNVLSGPSVLIVDGIKGALLVDARTYPVRGIAEPQKDKSLRGSRDGFVETLVFNTAMLRRRIRSQSLRMEYFQIGSNSKVDIALSYMEGLADEKTVKRLKERLKSIKIKSISMTQQALAEALVPHGFFNPFPKFKFTERPDFASAAVLDGKIVLIMDNCPSVMILPDSFADFFREVDDYYFMPVIGSYTRILRLLVSVFTVIATPLYLLFINNPQYVPKWLSFLSEAKSGAIPLLAQFIILEFVIDGLRLAAINTPDTLSNPLGIIGGLLLSEFAINAGWFTGEAILFMAVVTIASFSQPSFEMAYAMKFERILLLILTQIFDIWGFVGGIVICIIFMALNKTLSGRGYLYPVIPFNFRAFIGLFARSNIKGNH